MSVEVREAKLFEAAEYPDRGISFNEADLDAIIAGFNDPVPVRVQHGPSPWDGKFGNVIKIWRSGKDLMGSIEWPVHVWEFLCKMGTKSLSVGFDWRQRRLQEVSVVDRPRVLTARAFDDSITKSELMVFGFDFSADQVGGYSMEVTKELQAVIDSAVEQGRKAGRADAEAAFSEREGNLLSQLAERDRKDAKSMAAVKLAMFKAEGKLVPAAEKYAESILVDGSNQVTFSDGGHMTAAEAFVQFMTYQPAVVEIPGDKDGGKDKTEVSDKEKQVYDSLGVTPEEVAQYA